MRLRTRLLVGTTAVAVVLGAALAPAPAEDTFPSWRYPASLQSGYRLSSDAWTARVSSSGQWVLFTTVDWENLGAEKLYLRDRWTDRTTYLADVVDGRSTTMSDNGRFVTYWATDASTTIRDLTGGATVTATGSVMAPCAKAVAGQVGPITMSYCSNASKVLLRMMRRTRCAWP